MSEVVDMAQIVSGWATLAAAAFAAYSALQSRKAVDAVSVQMRVTVYHQFQERFRQIQEMLPPEVNKLEWVDIDGKHTRAIQLYWYLVLDEWIVCNKTHAELKSLWVDTYSKGVLSAMRREAFVSVLKKNISEEQHFLGNGPAFLRDLDALYKAADKNRSDSLLDLMKKQ